MYQAVEIIVPLAAFAMVFGIVYVGVTSSNRKELAMIEAGMNPNEAKNSGHSKIRTGLLFLLVPLGIFIGNVIANFFPVIGADSLGLIFAFIFGGMALTASYFIEKIFEKKNNDLN